MKKILSILLIGAMLTSSCSLEEEPPFLSNVNVYSTPENATKALDGLYQGLMGYDLYSNVYYFLNGLYSGMMLSRRGGNSVNTIYNSTLGHLNAPSGELNAERVWSQLYVTIGRTNDAIANAVSVETPVTEDEKIINDVVGQAHFIRAYCYFLLVNYWGEVPLRLEPTTSETIHISVSGVKEVYDQIINDIQIAQSLMNGSAGPQYAKVNAADMLMAKVYMNLATAPADVQDGSSDYWLLAYDEAIKVYGNYALVADYADLFREPTSDGNSENIFELQSSDLASHDWVRAFTPNNFTKANSFGWLQVNADFYDLHASTYPGDPRLTSTYLTSWVQQNNGSVTKKYPENATRNNFGNAHPFFFKLSEKDQNNTTQVGNQNVVLFRYADLLLMLAEISNELQNGEQLSYVTEVLSRVGMSPQAKYNGTQVDFREAIMREYQFELLGEGLDCINIRRRGYGWLRTNIIDFHNNYSLFDPSVDVAHDTDSLAVMHLLIPDAERNTNQKIN